jgi:type II secretory ATPase GspE/PulE/Tfp pilus assembly ATPase PilB-like protein
MPPLQVNSQKSKHTNTQEVSFSSMKDDPLQVDEAMFRLIDGILPFEACLYHQVVPLSLEGTRLNLGMVDTNDTEALDYVRRILAYMNCSLSLHPLSAKNHQALLSAYLSHTGQLKQTLTSTSAQEIPKEQLNQQNKATLILDDEESAIEYIHQTTSSVVISPPTVPQNFPAPKPQPASTKTTHKAQTPPSVPKTGLSLPALEVEPQYLSSPIEVLAELPPHLLLNELLARVLAGGIGRLYLERHSDKGRILWSQNGVLQLVLENVKSSVFQGLIQELKRLTHLPMLPVEKPKQVEIERIYKQNRLLLRLRVMPGTYGEEATLQVLRGAALKFYQQQQLENLSRDALNIAQQLQQKVNEIRDRTNLDPSLNTDKLEALPALGELVHNLEEQIKHLRILQAQPRNDQQKPN